MLELYLVGGIISCGFFLGLAIPISDILHMDDPDDIIPTCLLILAVAVVMFLIGWIGVVAMIANRAYVAEKRQWDKIDND